MLTDLISPQNLIFAASLLLIIQGIAHMMKTGAILKEFKSVISAHRRLFMMGWIVQGIFICSIGLFAILGTILFSAENRVVIFFIRFSAGTLLLLGCFVGMTGSRSEVVVVRASMLTMIVCAFTYLLAGAV